MSDEVESLIKQLMAEIAALREENVRILERLDRASLPAKRQVVQHGDRIRLLKVAEIAFITTKGDGIEVFAADGQRYLVFEGIGEAWKRIGTDPHLMRPHKSFIINLDAVRSIDKDDAGRAVFFHGWPDETTARVTNDSAAEFDRRLGYV